MTLPILFASLGVHLILLLRTRKEDRIFQGILFFSNLYFCGGAYYFWLVVQETYFTGFFWGEQELGRAILVLTISTTIVAAFIAIISQRARKFKPIIFKSNYQDVPLAVWVLCGVGFIASLYVFVYGILGGVEARGAYFLIAYQCSDLFVPVILFLVAVRGVSKASILLIGYFVLYASLVGFRYKIALLAIPLIALLLFSESRKSKKFISVGLFGGAVLALFSLLTLFRSKFSGINLDRSLDNVWFDLQYGFFAESNILFGLSSIFEQYIDKEQFYFFEPVVDIFREWVPRFLMPDRITGAYLLPMKFGFITHEGVNSGTAYPFIGEFAIMLGWWGVALGLVGYSILYMYFRRLICRVALTKELWICGLGLVSAVMAYYHFSRGYLPQIAKSYIFIVFPYLYFCVQHKRKFRLFILSAKLKRPQSVESINRSLNIRNRIARDTNFS